MVIAKVWLSFTLAAAGLLQPGCGGSAKTAPAPAPPTDYAVASHWVNLPATPSKEVDVFYVFPTVYKAGPTDPNLAPIDNPALVAGGRMAFAYQTTAFSASANLFAPYYRQAEKGDWKDDTTKGRS